MLLLAPASRAASAESAMSVEGLRCEYLTNPLGIDVESAAPELGVDAWAARAAAECLPGAGGQQPGETSEKDQGDLWDSGKVSSDQTAFVTYAGRPLAIRQRKRGGKSASGIKMATRLRGAPRPIGRWGCFATRNGTAVDWPGASG